MNQSFDDKDKSKKEFEMSAIPKQSNLKKISTNDQLKNGILPIKKKIMLHFHQLLMLKTVKSNSKTLFPLTIIKLFLS
jgi:hypothetical protein